MPWWYSTMYKPRLMFQLASQPVYTTHQQNAYDFEMKAVKPAKKKQLQSHAAYALLQFQVATVNIVIAMHISMNFCKMPKVFPKFSPR